jgi:hypothetical protein
MEVGKNFCTAKKLKGDGMRFRGNNVEIHKMTTTRFNFEAEAAP